MHFRTALAFVVPCWLLACGAGSGAPASAPSSTSQHPAAAAAAAPTPAAATTPPPGAGARAADGSPEGFAVYSASDLKERGKLLAPKMNEKKSASEPLGKFGNHSTILGHREGSGEAEVHDTLADFFVVEDGEARLVVGGTVENPATKSPGEIRGTAITGGVTRNLKAGDIVHIPAKMPHQLLLEPGAQFTYFVIKVETPKP